LSHQSRHLSDRRIARKVNFGKVGGMDNTTVTFQRYRKNHKRLVHSQAAKPYQG
jgi:hypothetical protein